MKPALTDLQKLDRAMSIIYGCATMILQDRYETGINVARARTILNTIDALREQLTKKEKV